MKRSTNILIALLLALVMSISAATAFSAAAAVKGKITVSSVKAKAGRTVTVTVTMDTNPGIATADFELVFDTDVLTLTNVKDEGFIKANDAQYAGPAHSDNLVSPYHLSWCNDLATANTTKTGKMVTLTFAIAANAQPGDYTISVASGAELYDYNTKPVDFAFVSGIVTVVPTSAYILGDVDGNESVTLVDASLIQRRLANLVITGIFNEKSADVDGNGSLTIEEATFIQRFVTKMNTPYKIGEFVV